MQISLMTLMIFQGYSTHVLNIMLMFVLDQDMFQVEKS